MKKIQKHMLIISGAVFVVSSVFLTIESVASGAEMASLRDREAELINQRQLLNEGFVKSISVSELQTQSESLGFVKPTNLIYVQEGSGVASKN
jgi:hypothetical protein